MNIHCILFGLFILYFFLPCALLQYPANVTRLQVNGQEANETYTIDENKEVNVSCSFVGGKPLGTVRLLDNRGHEYNTTIHANNSLRLSLGPYRCHDEWPTIRCEAPGSKLNRSVIVLIRCPAQFSDMNGEDSVVSRSNEGGASISIKSHTHVVKCKIRGLARILSEKEVDCKVSGRLPYLNLTLNITTDCPKEESWTLSITNDIRTSIKTFNVCTSPHREFWKTILLLSSSCLLGATIVTAGVIVCVLNRRPLDDSSDCITDTRDATIQAKTPGQKNPDGLVYGELDFSDKISSDVIIGSLPETQYANINFAASANTFK